MKLLTKKFEPTVAALNAITKVDMTTNDLIYFDDKKYSTTTSFIQNCVLKVFK